MQSKTVEIEMNAIIYDDLLRYRCSVIMRSQQDLLRIRLNLTLKCESKLTLYLV